MPYMTDIEDIEVFWVHAVPNSRGNIVEDYGTNARTWSMGVPRSVVQALLHPCCSVLVVPRWCWGGSTTPVIWLYFSGLLSIWQYG